MTNPDGGHAGGEASDAELSIVVPAFDEAERLPSTLAKIAEHASARGLRVEVLVVDDGSHDDTAAVARRSADALGLELRVLSHHPNRGKGYAARVGMLAARAPAVLLTDADLSVPIEHLDDFLPRLAGADVVSGSRRVPGARVALHQPKQREWLGAVFRGLAALLLVGDVSDFTCGFKLFRREAARAIFARSLLWGWGYDVEILYLAGRLGLRRVEAPVTWYDDRRSRVRLWKDVPRSFVDLLRIRWNAWRGRYDAAPEPVPEPSGTTPA